MHIVMKIRMPVIGKSELKFEEIPNKTNRKIRISIFNALERRYTFFNGYK